MCGSLIVFIVTSIILLIILLSFLLVRKNYSPANKDNITCLDSFSFIELESKFYKNIIKQIEKEIEEIKLNF